MRPPAGITRIAAPWALLLALLATVLPWPAALAAGAIATVQELEGTAFAYPKGEPAKRLALNDTVTEQTRIATSKDTTLVLVFTDETELTLGDSTIVNLDGYHYRDPARAAGRDEEEDEEEDEEAQEPSFSTSILSGVVRTVTGLIAKARPRRVAFRTSVGTIGIRGTHFTAEVQGSSATIILLAQATEGASNAIEVSNQYGRVEIDKPGYGTEIPDAHSPPSPPRRMEPTNHMNRILRSVNTTRRVRIPRSPMR